MIKDYEVSMRVFYTINGLASEASWFNTNLTLTLHIACEKGTKCYFVRSVREYKETTGYPAMLKHLNVNSS